MLGLQHRNNSDEISNYYISRIEAFIRIYSSPFVVKMLTAIQNMTQTHSNIIYPDTEYRQERAIQEQALYT